MNRFRHPVTVTDWNPLDPADRTAVSALVLSYHLHTEAEKGATVASVDELPQRYRAEVADPGHAFAGSTVLLARSGASAVPPAALGMLALSATSPGWSHVSRLWVEPPARGQGIARLLLEEAAEQAGRVGAGLRLSVWEWRTSALRLYRRLGFEIVPSWEARAGLVCLERPSSRQGHPRSD